MVFIRKEDRTLDALAIFTGQHSLIKANERGIIMSRIDNGIFDDRHRILDDFAFGRP